MHTFAALTIRFLLKSSRAMSFVSLPVSEPFHRQFDIKINFLVQINKSRSVFHKYRDTLYNV